MFLTYKTDTWHTQSSRVLIGVATDKDIAIDLCRELAEKESALFRDHEYCDLVNMNQTQDYLGDGEFVIEEVKINILL